MLNWIQNRADVSTYFTHFKGGFKTEWFDSDVPPPLVLRNHKSCIPFAKFISHTILQRLSTGAISIWGRVGDIQPPHLVMPLTWSPETALCNDNRFLNLWMIDRPFHPDSLRGIPVYVNPASYQTVCDDKSGYDHIFMKESSRTFFGFKWGG